MDQISSEEERKHWVKAYKVYELQTIFHIFPHHTGQKLATQKLLLHFTFQSPPVSSNPKAIRDIKVSL